MTLQYRPDTLRLLHLASGDLMNECCCEEVVPPDYNHIFYNCCVGTYDELISHPIFVVITDTKYIALGSPDCVVYGDCCYCSHSTTLYWANVPSSNVTASTHSDCDSCGADEGSSCDQCVSCNDCEPRHPVQFTATISVSGYCGHISTANQAKITADISGGAPWLPSYVSSGTCFWKDITGIYGTRPNGYVLTGGFQGLELQWRPLGDVGYGLLYPYWRIYSSSPLGGVSFFGLFNADPCDATGVYINIDDYFYSSFCGSSSWANSTTTIAIS